MKCERTDQLRVKYSWVCSPTTRRFENPTLEKIGQNSTVVICGGSVETGLVSLVDGRFAHPAGESGVRRGIAAASGATTTDRGDIAVGRCGAPQGQLFRGVRFSLEAALPLLTRTFLWLIV
jgi:hypothetical protein